AGHRAPNARIAETAAPAHRTCRARTDALGERAAVFLAVFSHAMLLHSRNAQPARPLRHASPPPFCASNTSTSAHDTRARTMSACRALAASLAASQAASSAASPAASLAAAQAASAAASPAAAQAAA